LRHSENEKKKRPTIGFEGIVGKVMGLGVESIGFPSSRIDLRSLVEDDL